MENYLWTLRSVSPPVLLPLPNSKYFVMRKTLFLWLFFCQAVTAQKLKKEDRQLLSGLQQHIQFLAHDKLEGRRTGTMGEKLAMAYISEQFKNAGLQPKGTDGYFQAFEIYEGRQPGSETAFSVNGHPLQLHKEFFPLAYSSNIKMEVLPSIALEEPDMPWFLDLKDVLEEHAANPHFDVHEFIRNKVNEVHKKRATALFVYNTGTAADALKFDERDASPSVALPVVYLTKEAVQKYFSDESATLDIRMNIAIAEKTRTGTNVIGYLDNGAAATVVLGAHYDHLGYGEDRNTLFAGGAPQVHNGADDNASGTAAMIELARLLKAGRSKNSNYLFIAFSGEELGLFGSKYFTEHPTINLATVNYMINMDMVGRLDHHANTITVGGFGTSPAWSSVFTASGRNSVYAGPLQYRFDSSGTGPSDHTSFYRKGIPVLFYFTGLHADYHRPSDDFDKINYEGTVHLVKHIYSVMEKLDSQPRITFLETAEPRMTTSARFTVTLGIMPDYTFRGPGVRVDGVSEGRPAQLAGIKTGDVIVQLGAVSVGTLEAYMQALGTFKKGDKTVVYFNRNNDRMSATVVF